MRQFFITAFFTVTTQLLYGQNDSTQLVRFDELTFNSASEKQYYEELYNDKPAYFELLASIDSTTTNKDISAYSQRLYFALDEFNNTKWQNKKPEKKIKTIYEKIHTIFFDQYSLENNFSDVFTSGKYNCVSATGVYALALDKLNIPYVIKEEPTHVYLIAYPNSERIIVEATNPAAGYTQFNEAFKKDFVNRLTKAKIIGSLEAQQSNINQLFDKYYFTKNNIQLKELVALQYYNDGLYKMEGEQYELAFTQLEKSYLLYENERIGYLLYMNGASFLRTLPIEDLRYAPMVLRIARFKDYGVKNEQIIAEYQQLANLYLFKNGDVAKNDKLYNDFKKVSPDSSYQNTISYLYNFEAGRYNYTKGKYAQALEYLAIAYNIKPNDAQAQSILVSAIAQQASRLNNIEKTYAFLDQYGASYPNLIENDNFKIMLANVKLEMASFYYYTNKAKQAELYLAKFEALSMDDIKTLNENSISKAYVSAAMYYYRKGAVSSAQKHVGRGLQILPNDFNLTRLKQMMR